MKKFILVLLCCMAVLLISSCKSNVNHKIDKLEKMGYSVKVNYISDGNEYAPIIELYIERYDNKYKRWAYAQQYKTKEAAELKFKAIRLEVQADDGSLPFNIGLDGKWVSWGEAVASSDILQ